MKIDFITNININDLKKSLKGNYMKDNITPLTIKEISEAKQQYSYLKGLSEKSVLLAVRKPQYWRYRLYCQSFLDEIDSYESLRLARSLGFMPGKTESVSMFDFPKWMLDRHSELQELTNHFSEIMNHELQVAFQKSVELDSFESIILVSRKLGLIYKQFIEISIRCKILNADDVFDGVLKEMSKFSDNVINEFEQYPKRTLDTIMTTILDSDGITAQTIRLTMVLNADPAPLSREIQKLSELFSSETTNNDSGFTYDTNPEVLAESYKVIFEYFSNLDNMIAQNQSPILLPSNDSQAPLSIQFKESLMGFASELLYIDFQFQKTLDKSLLRSIQKILDLNKEEILSIANEVRFRKNHEELSFDFENLLTLLGISVAVDCQTNASMSDLITNFNRLLGTFISDSVSNENSENFMNKFIDDVYQAMQNHCNTIIEHLNQTFGSTLIDEMNNDDDDLLLEIDDILDFDEEDDNDLYLEV